MTPIEVAYRVFGGQVNIKGNEIIPQYCPFCKGGEHKDRGTFAINIDTGVYNCKRGKCQEHGHLTNLCEHFGLSVDKPIKSYEFKKPFSKTYKKPITETKPVTTEIEKYVLSRKFSKATWESRRIGESNNRITFPYYENGELVAVKFRAKDEKGKWKKFSMEQGGKLVFWGMDNCDPDFPLIITEGEFDAMTLDECGIPNAVSLPNGVNGLECFDICWDWLKQFKQYYIWTDMDDAGIKCRQDLVNRLGIGKCMIVQCKRKDANEVLFYDGKDAVIECISQAQPIPLEGLKDLADLPEYDPGKDVVVSSGIPGMDDAMNGGFRMGEVSIWTGLNSSGKSTLLGQILLQSVETGFKVCAYSGELPDRIFRYWIDLQAAGLDYTVQTRRDGRTITMPGKNYINYIRDWYRGKFFLYDSHDAVSQEKILEVFQYSFQRYNCQVFMVDNLMSLALGTDEKNFYRKQADFVGFCKDFARDYNVHIHIVAHPRKPARGQDLNKMDVSGLADITNWADNVFEVKRYSENEIKKMKENEKLMGQEIKNALHIMKNRFTGRQDIFTLLGFEEVSKRFYPSKDGTPNWEYGWVKAIGKQSTVERLAGWEELGMVKDE